MKVILAVLTSIIVCSLMTEPICSASVVDSTEAPTKIATHSPETAGQDIGIVFSDVDGTLVHYPGPDSSRTLDDDDDNLIPLPPSSTGMRGIVSAKTLHLCSEIRRRGVKLVLVSGMRGSTLQNRLPYLPKADAYCSDNGGRIFYPSSATADEERPSSQQLIEDVQWKQIMSSPHHAGLDGYDNAPLSHRQGHLWQFARDLEHQGWVVDCKGYATCFRMRLNNQKNQSSEMEKQFEDLPSSAPQGIVSSVNLGCIDFYPQPSGKKHCCEYLAKKLLPSNNDSLSRSCICLCDDDNDLEMAMACRHAYIPGVTSHTMRETISQNPHQFTVTESHDCEETDATEKALELILDRISVLN